MGKHPYGERYLDSNSPPSTATGLIIRQWYERDEINHNPSWFESLVFMKKEPRYFVFRWISGSYDYHCKYNGGMCGGFTAAMGYWHYATEEERDAKYAELIKE